MRIDLGIKPNYRKILSTIRGYRYMELRIKKAEPSDASALNSLNNAFNERNFDYPHKMP